MARIGWNSRRRKVRGAFNVKSGSRFPFSFGAKADSMSYPAQTEILFVSAQEAWMNKGSRQYSNRILKALETGLAFGLSFLKAGVGGEQLKAFAT